MKKKMITGIVILLCILSGVVFAVRFTAVNRRYPKSEEKVYSVGEPVNLGGYTFTLTQMELIDGTELEGRVTDVTYAEDMEGNLYDGERMRVLMAHIQIEKNSDSDEFIDFTRINVESGAWHNGLDAELYMAMNEGISVQKLVLEKGEQCEVILPFSMICDMFKKRGWEKIDEREFSLVFAFYPEKIVMKKSK